MKCPVCKKALESVGFSVGEKTAKNFYYCASCDCQWQFEGDKWTALIPLERLSSEQWTEIFPNVKSPVCKRHNSVMTFGRYSNHIHYKDAHVIRDGHSYYCNECVDELRRQALLDKVEQYRAQAKPKKVFPVGYKPTKSGRWI